LRQVDVAVFDTGAGYGGDEEGAAEQKLVVRVVGRLVFRVLEEEGPQDRGAGPMALFKEGVEVGEKTLPKLDHLPAYRLVRLTKDPRLLVDGLLHRVVPTEGLKDPKFSKPGQ
jgi:hypothetical protein